MTHTIELLKKKSNLFLSLSSIKINSIDRPVEITRRHSMEICWAGASPPLIYHHLVDIVWFFFFVKIQVSLFCATDVGFGGWENIWEIMQHGTKWWAGPLRPTSIIKNSLIGYILCPRCFRSHHIRSWSCRLGLRDLFKSFDLVVFLLSDGFFGH